MSGSVTTTKSRNASGSWNSVGQDRMATFSTGPVSPRQITPWRFSPPNTSRLTPIWTTKSWCRYAWGMLRVFSGTHSMSKERVRQGATAAESSG